MQIVSSKFRGVWMVSRRVDGWSIGRYLVPPNQTFYSVWPTKNMVKRELQKLRDEGYTARVPRTTPPCQSLVP